MKRAIPIAAAVLVLGLLIGQSPAALAQIKGPHEERVKKIKELAKKGDLEAVKSTATYLTDKHPFPRDEAFKKLCEVKDEKAIEWLSTEALMAKDADVRADLIEIVAMLGAKRAVPSLLKLLPKDDRNRPLIVSALGQLGSKEDAGPLAAELKRQRDARTRAELIEAIAALDPAAAIEPAQAAAKKGEWQERVAALRALAAIDEDAAFEGALANLRERRADAERRKHGHWQPAFMSMRVLLGLKKRAKRVEGLREAIDDLVALLDKEKGESGRMRHEVGGALRALTGKADMDDEQLGWEEWWRANRERYAPEDAAPPQRRGGGKKEGGEQESPEAGATAVGTTVRFHGVPVFSDRVAFVIDLSGSMQNPMPVKDDQPAAGGGSERKGLVEKRKLDVSKEELIKTIASLPEEVMFNIICFGTEVRSWQEHLTAATKQAKAAATEFASKLEIEGRTNFYGALSKPLDDPLVDTIYFLSDGGMTTEGKYIDQRRIVRKLHEVNKYALNQINCLLFGAEERVSAPARRWMESLCEESGGKFTIRP